MKKIFTCIMMVSFLVNLSYKACAIASKHNPSIKKTAMVRLHGMLAANVVKKIEYGFSSAKIRSTYYAQLDQLAKIAADKNYVLALRGYADSIGNYTANWHLSEKRAAVIKDYLIKKGITENHIITTAFGSTKPVASNKTSIGRQRNRRVEIQLNDMQP